MVARLSLARHFGKAMRLAAKEWTLLLRNPHGLVALFLMPGVFVLVMSLTLKNTLVEEIELPVSGWLVEERHPAATAWSEQWLAQYGGRRFESRDALLGALQSRQVEAGVVVREGWIGADGQPHSEQLELWLSNRVQPAAAARLRAELVFSTLQVRASMAAAEAGLFGSMLLSDIGRSELLAARNAPTIRYVYEIQSGRPMTAVQQSVPAWLVFGMFFVVIPIAGVFIQERNDGTLVRLAMFGVSPAVVLGGKLIAFMLLNWIQLACMLMVGLWLVPALGGDALRADVSLGWFALMVLATSAAAVGMALLIAAYTRTFDHAAALGGGLNVVLGAIAGVMVPRMLMPAGLQTVSEWSPMGWALDGMQSVFLGDPDAQFILPRATLLLIFAAICLALAWRPTRHFGKR